MLRDWTKTVIVEPYYKKPFLSRWFFDVEIFARTIVALGYKESMQAILEVPLQKWLDKGGSKVTFYHFLKAPWELLRIFLSYKHALKNAKSTN